MVPNAALLRSEVAAPKFVVLKRLKASIRNSTLETSLIGSRKLFSKRSGPNRGLSGGAIPPVAGAESQAPLTRSS
jgi:hypothetical protein